MTVEPAYRSQYARFQISEKGNFAFLEDGTGYYLSGMVLLKTPYTGEFNNQVIPGINKIIAPLDLDVKQIGNQLEIICFSNPVQQAIIHEVTGNKILSGSGNGTVKMDIGNLPNGIYLLSLLFEDEGIHTIKWIKK